MEAGPDTLLERPERLGPLLEAFSSASGRRFHRGVLLYTGREIVPFSKNVHALPAQSLWSAAR